MIDAEALFAPLRGRRCVALAVSGGADSLALMVLAGRWAAAAGFGAPRLVVYSVDHGLRQEAAGEVRFVADVATRLGLSVRGMRWEGAKPATGLQAAARAVRYRLMAAAMAEDDADLLLTAHHREDQAETVLMRLAHGSGVEGLKGMARFATIEGCRVYRPFLDIGRDELRAVVTEAGLVPVDDPSNVDTDYERVRWRLLLPELSGMGLTAGRLATFARRMAELDELTASAADAAHASIVHYAADGRALIDRAAFCALPRPVAVRLLAGILNRTGGGRKPHALSVIETLQTRLTLGEPMKRMTLHGCLVAADGTTIQISVETGRSTTSERSSVTTH